MSHPSGVLDAPASATAYPAWPRLTSAVEEIRTLQSADGSIPAAASETPDAQQRARVLLAEVVDCVTELAPSFPHDADYHAALVADLERWAAGGFGVPDFLDSLLAFRPERHRVDGLEHLVVFPMYTQNGNPDRNLEALIVRVVWPDWLANLEATRYDNAMFVPVTFEGFTSGYDTDSAVLFPETVAVREVPRYTWGGIFCDREAARFRRVASAAATGLGLDLPPEAAELVASQARAQEAFTLWDLVHDRSHMHGPMPFDPFMIKQRMPFWMYSLEELRCDLTAYREAVTLEREGLATATAVRYAILFDRLFRFPVTGGRVRNYDGLGGQLLFAHLYREGVVSWGDNRLTIDWEAVTPAVLALYAEVDALYRAGVGRSKVGHWMAAYDLVTSYVPAHPASVWARGADALPLDGPPKGLVDAVLPDEFPLSMFYEALARRLGDVIASTRGITAVTAQEPA